MNSSTLLCQAPDSALVTIDIQERLARAMPDADLATAVQRISLLLRAASVLEVPVLTTEQYPKGLGDTLEQISTHLPAASERLDKTSFSCCSAPGFSERLQRLGRGQIILTGMEAHVCVLQTAVDLTQAGYAVFVVADAVCSRSRERTANALARLRHAGVCVTHSESVLFEWLRDARHPQFRTVSRLLKEEASDT